ncbi:GntR family transcriptional regulator, partial [Streptomyces sp. NPDC059466]|uniref:GntR family transcriptional regulator n=1 Tax=Streptomyces sp. NPDC059466 TaxID=3346843 RepID=UPI00369EEE82
MTSSGTSRGGPEAPAQHTPAPRTPDPDGSAPHIPDPDASARSGPGPAGPAPWTAAWELLLPTASAPARARGRALQGALREAVRTGRLAPGTRLPSSRELAVDLGVSRGVVSEGFEHCGAVGYL